MTEKKISFPLLLLLQLAVCIYSCSGIPAKLASNYPFLSLPFVLYYALEIVLLGIYAVFWQQIIRKVDISVAYANRASSIFWSTLLAVVIFKDTLSVKNLVGIGIIFAGIWMVNRDA